VTRPENARPTETPPRPKQPEATADEPSSNGTATPSPDRQRQPGDADPKTVTLQMAAPERIGAISREQTDRQQPGSRDQGSASAPGGHEPPSPPTVRIGGYTPPERIPPASPPSTQVRPARIPRRTSLQLHRLEPWSVLKLSLVLSIAGFLAWMVAVGVLYGALAGMGVWEQLNGTYSDLTSASNPAGGTELISGGRVFGVALVVGLVNIVLMTALATVGSLIYNIATDLVGGIEVTLSEPD
jgi:Transmembrane domain of unknown function (DUF3566)